MMDATGDAQSLLIVGGTSDIATAIAEQMAGRRLRRVRLLGRDADRLSAAEARLQSMGVDDVTSIPFQAEEGETHAEVFDRAWESGDVDVAVFAVGLLGDQASLENDPAAAAHLAHVNYVAAVSCLLRIAEKMRTQGHGLIIVLSSVAAERPRRSNFVYGSSKAGLDAFATGLRESLRGTGVRLLLVRPGFVRSKMTAGLDAAAMATTPASVAVEVTRAVRRQREVVWIPTKLRWVMMILKLLPAPIFRRLPI